MTSRPSLGPWLAVLVLAASGLAIWKFMPREATVPTPAPVAAAPAADAVAPAPAPAAPAHPIGQVAVPPAEATEPLPALEDSDAAARAALSALAGDELAAWLVPEHLLRRLVTTIDALPRRDVTRQVYAARDVPGMLAVSESGGRRYLDAANFARYDAAVRLFESLDSRALVGAYVRFYPLLQQAYREIAGPDRHFNDRLVEVLDHLLAAPEPGPVLELVPADGRPRWAFADPRLEGASIGHKALWRMGPDHAARVKAKLAALRELVAAQRPAA